MDLARLSGRRFWLWLLLLLIVAAVLVWFIPAVRAARQQAPVHLEVGLTDQCGEEFVGQPDYGSRDPVSYCAG